MSELTQEQHQKIEEKVERRVHRDRVLLNNPVIMQGLGLAPLVIAASTGRNALMLSVAVFLLLTPTRLLAAALCRFVHARFRGAAYALSASVIYIGMYWVMTRLFQSGDITQLGLYLPLLVVDPIILKRYERVQNEKLNTALRKGIVTTLGYMLVLMIMGCVRELLGSGMLFGHVIINIALMPSALLPSGGFAVLAIVMALWRSAVRVMKRSMAETEEDQWEVE
ncbi:MAG: Rnf-Nqr domain containing protein [Ruthenibacterium sp.]